MAQAWAQPLLTAQVCGVGVAALLEAAWQLHRGGRLVRVVQASSAEMFGIPARASQSEATPMTVTFTEIVHHMVDADLVQPPPAVRLPSEEAGVAQDDG